MEVRRPSALAAATLALATLALATVACPTSHASARTRTRGGTAPGLALRASFAPERLGEGTTVSVGFAVSYAPGEAPKAVTDVKLLYPAGLGIGTSELGLQTCDPTALGAIGPAACPHNSLMGHGTAKVKVPFGPREVAESAPITIFSQPLSEGHIGLLFSVSGYFPVIANLEFGAFVLPAGGRYGGTIDTVLPLLTSVPKGPDVALVGLSTTIGPRGILYSEKVGPHTVSFHPKGFLLPDHCPRGGFQFAAHLTFADGSSAAARTAVPCPHVGRPKRG